MSLHRICSQQDCAGRLARVETFVKAGLVDVDFCGGRFQPVEDACGGRGVLLQKPWVHRLRVPTSDAADNGLLDTARL